MSTAASQLQTTITEDQHSPVVRFATATLLSLSVSSVVVRLIWIRRPLRSLFGVDDLTTIICLVFAIIQAICLLLALRYGFAQKTRDTNGDSSMKIIFVGDVLYILALSLSRLAMSLFCRRLTRPSTRERAAFTILSGLIAASWVTGTLLLAIQPPYLQPWQGPLENASRHFVRWVVIECFGVIEELLMFCLVSALVWRLQMTTDKKLAVTMAFTTRLPIITFVILRLRSLKKIGPSSDFNFHYTEPQIWLLAELHYSLIAATIPSLHIFLKNLTTGWLADLKDRPETAMATKSTTSRHNGLSIVRSKKTVMRSEDRGSVFELRDWKENKMKTRAFAPKDARSDDAASDESESRILVRKTIDVSHEVTDQ